MGLFEQMKEKSPKGRLLDCIAKEILENQPALATFHCFSGLKGPRSLSKVFCRLWTSSSFKKRHVNWHKKCKGANYGEAQMIKYLSQTALAYFPEDSLTQSSGTDVYYNPEMVAEYLAFKEGGGATGCGGRDGGAGGEQSELDTASQGVKLLLDVAMLAEPEFFQWALPVNICGHNKGYLAECYVADSSIPGAGKGIFVKNFMPKNSIITFYSGNDVGRATALEKKAAGTHGWLKRVGSIFHSVFLDGTQQDQFTIQHMADHSLLGSMINDSGANRSGRVKNMREHTARLYYVALFDLKANTEILTSYDCMFSKRHNISGSGSSSNCDADQSSSASEDKAEDNEDE
eukprot:2505064-Rhodomonas_salina.1